MKKCPRCELNYIEDDEEMCDVCYETIERNENPKYDRRIMAKNEVGEDKIHNGITATQIFQSVRYLTYKYGEYSIYDTDNTMSYRSILNKLKTRFHYAKIKYNCGAGFAYVFQAEEIWEKFFLADEEFKATIIHREIESVYDLVRRAYAWHSLS